MTYDALRGVDSDQLRAFVAVARSGRFTEAARRLATSQPTLSRRVQQLEREVGARLVVRGPGGVVLTGAGARFLPQAENAVASIDAGISALDELASQPSGLVAIGAQPTIGAYALPSVLATFHQVHPSVRLRTVEALPGELEERLARGDLNLVLLNLPVRRVDLTAQSLWHEDYVLAVPLDHRLASSRRPIALTDATQEGFVVIPNVPATAAIEAACAERGIEPKIVVEVDNLETARRMVEHGIGLALLPRIVAQSRASAHLSAPARAHAKGSSGRRGFFAVEIARGGLRRQIALVHRGEAYLSAAARALKAAIVEQLAVRPRTAKATRPS